MINIQIEIIKKNKLLIADIVTETSADQISFIISSNSKTELTEKILTKLRKVLSEEE